MGIPITTVKMGISLIMKNVDPLNTETMEIFIIFLPKNVEIPIVFVKRGSIIVQNHEMGVL